MRTQLSSAPTLLPRCNFPVGRMPLSTRLRKLVEVVIGCSTSHDRAQQHRASNITGHYQRGYCRYYHAHVRRAPRLSGRAALDNFPQRRASSTSVRGVAGLARLRAVSPCFIIRAPLTERIDRHATSRAQTALTDTSPGWGTMVGVGWLVVMDDWLLRGGALARCSASRLAVRCYPIGWSICRLVAAMPDAAGEIAYTAAAFSRPSASLPDG